LEIGRLATIFRKSFVDRELGQILYDARLAQTSFFGAKFADREVGAYFCAWCAHVRAQRPPRSRRKLTAESQWLRLSFQRADTDLPSVDKLSR
jgi:hypothetical protein